MLTVALHFRHQSLEWTLSGANHRTRASLPQTLSYLWTFTIEQALQRGQFGEERYEKEEFQRTVQETFLALKNPSWKIIDASKSIEDVEQDVRAAALTAIEEASKGAPLKKLWGQ